MSRQSGCCRQSCCCKQTCCKPIGMNRYSGGGTFSSLVILILVLLFFGRGLTERRGSSCGTDVCSRETPREDNTYFGGIIFIITLYFLSCGCGRGGFGGLGGFGGGYGGLGY